MTDLERMARAVYHERCKIDLEAGRADFQGWEVDHAKPIGDECRRIVRAALSVLKDPSPETRAALMMGFDLKADPRTAILGSWSMAIDHITAQGGEGQ